jgi:hypothetical protein
VFSGKGTPPLPSTSAPAFDSATLFSSVIAWLFGGFVEENVAAKGGSGTPTATSTKLDRV